MKVLILACIALELFVFASCKKEGDTPINFDPTKVDGPTVYVAGDTNYMNNNPIAVYWKNGVRQALNTSFRGSKAKSIFVAGKDIYVAGDTISPSGRPVAVYWKNGTVISLSKTSDYFSDANSIYVSGADVYVAGYTTDVNTGSYATYWKNGKAVVIGSLQSVANSIVVSDTNIYIAGHTFNFGNYNTMATYWKNGAAEVIAGGVNSSEAKSLAVSGSDVYIAGYTSSGDNLRNIATYWKNGVATFLTDNSTNSSANSITVNGSDVYVAGYTKAPIPQYLSSPLGVALYWKNGTPVYLSNNGTISNAYAIAVNGNDVYISGAVVAESDYTATYWKNNSSTNLAISTYGNNIRNSVANAIVVVDK